MLKFKLKAFEMKDIWDDLPIKVNPTSLNKVLMIWQQSEETQPDQDLVIPSPPFLSFVSRKFQF